MMAEITAIISSQYPIQDLIEIGDALLAAPILAVEVMLDSANADTVISELRNRAGKHMHVAARDVQTPEQAIRAIEAGAQSLVCANLNSATKIDIQLTTQALNIPCIPTIGNIHGALPNIESFNKIKFRPVDIVTTDQVKSFCNMLPQTQVCVDLPVLGHSEIMHLIHGFIRAGAVGISVGQAIVADLEPAMADIITNARMLMASWNTAVRCL